MSKINVIQFDYQLDLGRGAPILIDKLPMEPKLAELGTNYANEIVRMFSMQNGQYDKCKKGEVSRYFENLKKFVDKYGNKKEYTFFDARIDKLEYLGYVPNLLHKMLEMVYNCKDNINEVAIQETVNYHNQMIRYYDDPSAIYLKGDIDAPGNKERIAELCSKNDVVYIIVCKSNKKGWDIDDSFFTKINKPVNVNINKEHPVLVKSIIGQQIWYVTSLMVLDNKTDNNRYQKSKQHFNERNIENGMGQLYNQEIQDKKGPVLNEMFTFLKLEYVSSPTSNMKVYNANLDKFKILTIYFTL